MVILVYTSWLDSVIVRHPCAQRRSDVRASRGLAVQKAASNGVPSQTEAQRKTLLDDTRSHGVSFD